MAFADSTDTNTVSLAMASNAFLAVFGAPASDRGKGGWCVAAVRADTGRPLWRGMLSDEPLPGGFLVDGAGQVVVACRSGDLICIGAM